MWERTSASRLDASNVRVTDTSRIRALASTGAQTAQVNFTKRIPVIGRRHVSHVAPTPATRAPPRPAQHSLANATLWINGSQKIRCRTSPRANTGPGPRPLPIHLCQKHHSHHRNKLAQARDCCAPPDNRHDVEKSALSTSNNLPAPNIVKWTTVGRGSVSAKQPSPVLGAANQVPHPLPPHPVCAATSPLHLHLNEYTPTRAPAETQDLAAKCSQV